MYILKKYLLASTISFGVVVFLSIIFTDSARSSSKMQSTDPSKSGMGSSDSTAHKLYKKAKNMPSTTAEEIKAKI